MTSVPRPLMQAWITMLASENTALWMPAGRPMRMTRLSTGPSRRSSRGLRRMGESMRQSLKNSTAAATV